ncbi:MAG: RNA-binding domain-containing protein [Candidatus Thalassarchaeaceae archaeon]|jgi:RNA binding exosome subunit|tara:strand:+ start:69 stop:515 length:447 start_codon:yes stop_codon:yes gene_type:complete
MGAHSVEWTIISSAVDDVDMIALALESVLPEGVEIEYENVKSHHGARQTMLRSRLNRKKDIRGSMSLVQKGLWDSILKMGIESRMDDSKFLHARLDLQKFVAGEHVLASRARSRHSVKLRIKIECYPGQEIIDEATTLLSRYAELDED